MFEKINTSLDSESESINNSGNESDSLLKKELRFVMNKIKH